jgi:AAA family ATP:ADP antiporter
MRGSTLTAPARTASLLDRALAVFADVRPGEGLTALLMLANIFLLLVCYSIIKTVREPLVLLGGGAEVRSYAAAGQALLLMGFVPLYGWAVSKVRRMPLVVGATCFFIVCIELFAAAVTARLPSGRRLLHLGRHLQHLAGGAVLVVHNDLYTRKAGAGTLIVIGMTAGAPLGSLVADGCSSRGSPGLILQVSAVLLALSGALYLVVNTRQAAHSAAGHEPLPGSGGFALVLANPSAAHRRAHRPAEHRQHHRRVSGGAPAFAEVQQLAALDPLFDKQAYVGAFTGTASSGRRHGAAAAGLRHLAPGPPARLTGVLFALPLIAMGGAIVAAGAGFALVRWIKTAENAADYSIMNTARQMLWLPTTREEKYKAKQAIDTFFVRGGDLLSAAVVFGGTHMLNLTVEQFALANLALTLVWLALAAKIARPDMTAPVARRRWVAVAAACSFVIVPSHALGQTASDAAPAGTRQEERAAPGRRPRSCGRMPDLLERHLKRAERMMFSTRPVYAFIGHLRRRRLPSAPLPAHLRRLRHHQRLRCRCRSRTTAPPSCRSAFPRSVAAA